MQISFRAKDPKVVDESPIKLEDKSGRIFDESAM